jgi:hypothetical protein
MADKKTVYLVAGASALLLLLYWLSNRQAPAQTEAGTLPDVSFPSITPNSYDLPALNQGFTPGSSDAVTPTCGCAGATTQYFGSPAAQSQYFASLIPQIIPPANPISAVRNYALQNIAAPIINIIQNIAPSYGLGTEPGR